MHASIRVCMRIGMARRRARRTPGLKRAGGAGSGGVWVGWRASMWGGQVRGAWERSAGGPPAHVGSCPAQPSAARRGTPALLPPPSSRAAPAGEAKSWPQPRGQRRTTCPTAPQARSPALQPPRPGSAWHGDGMAGGGWGGVVRECAGTTTASNAAQRCAASSRRPALARTGCSVASCLIVWAPGALWHKAWPAQRLRRLCPANKLLHMHWQAPTHRGLCRAGQAARVGPRGHMPLRQKCCQSQSHAAQRQSHAHGRQGPRGGALRA